jgi:hypothetical protein
MEVLAAFREYLYTTFVFTFTLDLEQVFRRGLGGGARVKQDSGEGGGRIQGHCQTRTVIGSAWPRDAGSKVLADSDLSAAHHLVDFSQ